MSPKDEDLSEEPPTSIDPYEVLGVEKEATADQIKTAYRKAALKHHPDKAQPDNKDAAHAIFQEIAFAYAILSDERRRKRYDLTGRTEDSLHLEDDDDFDWLDFYRAQCEDVVTGESIEKFKKEYQHSQEERDDLIAAYNNSKGSMNTIFSTIMLSNPLDDEERFRMMLDEEIRVGNIPGYSKYTKESESSKRKRMERARREGEEARELARELGVEDKLFGSNGKGDRRGGPDNTDALAALIQQRQKARGANFLADLEAKYAPKRSRKRGIEDEPPEEAFQKTAERIKSSKAPKRTKGASSGKMTKASEANGAAEESARPRRSKRTKR